MLRCAPKWFMSEPNSNKWIWIWLSAVVCSLVAMGIPLVSNEYDINNYSFFAGMCSLPVSLIGLYVVIQRKDNHRKSLLEPPTPALSSYEMSSTLGKAFSAATAASVVVVAALFLIFFRRGTTESAAGGAFTAGMMIWLPTFVYSI